MIVEQLRRSASGGIGTYVRGLLGGLDALAADKEAVPVVELRGQPAAGRFGEPIRSPSSAIRCTARCCPARS